MRGKINRIKTKLVHTAHNAHNPAHCLYFGLVAVEAGKWYGAVAALLLLITVLDMIASAHE